MAESVKALPTEIQQIIDVREWDMRTLEGVARFREIGASSLPGIAMDGTVVYSSIIPEQEEMIKELKRRFYEKNQLPDH